MDPIAVHPNAGALPRRFDFRVPLTLCIIAVLCGFFWIGSRYPSLQGKASADPPSLSFRADPPVCRRPALLYVTR